MRSSRTFGPEMPCRASPVTSRSSDGTLLNTQVFDQLVYKDTRASKTHIEIKITCLVKYSKKSLMPAYNPHVEMFTGNEMQKAPIVWE